MKRILFRHRTSLILNVLMIAFVFTACNKQSSDVIKQEEEIATAKAGGGKPGTVAEVPLRLSINDIGNKITSDGGGDYVNGSQNMKVVFDQYGNLIFDNRKSQGKPAQRVYQTNLDNPLQVIIDPGFTNGTGNYMATTKSNQFSSFTPIQNMTVGASQCITFHGGAGQNFVFSFHGGNEDNSASPTSFAVITRNSATEWTMTPGSCSISANTDVAALRLSGTLYGYYHMPFSFTLTKL